MLLSVTVFSVAEPDSVIVTVRPPVLRLLPLASFACRVIVELVPSAATEVGLAVSVELATVAAVAVKVTVAVSVTSVPLIAAVTVTVSAVVLPIVSV